MKTTESFGVIMPVLIFPMFFLSGAFFSLTNVPVWMTTLARFNPLTYGVDAMRRIILTDVPAVLEPKLFLYPLQINILVLFIFSAIMISLATLTFNRRG